MDTRRSERKLISAGSTWSIAVMSVVRAMGMRVGVKGAAGTIHTADPDAVRNTHNDDAALSKRARRTVFDETLVEWRAPLAQTKIYSNTPVKKPRLVIGNEPGRANSLAIYGSHKVIANWLGEVVKRRRCLSQRRQLSSLLFLDRQQPHAPAMLGRHAKVADLQLARMK